MSGGLVLRILEAATKASVELSRDLFRKNQLELRTVAVKLDLDLYGGCFHVFAFGHLCLLTYYSDFGFLFFL
jgi:hypothetical protein